MPSDKYPRTYHFPWSPNLQNDDRQMEDVKGFLGHEVVVTEKLDGGNFCFTREACYARTHAVTPKQWWYDRVKATWGRVQHQLGPHISVFGEDMYSRHSIVYTLPMPDVFLVFGVRNDEDMCWWSWDDVEDFARTVGLPTVPVLHRTVIDAECQLQGITHEYAHRPSTYGPESEGVVVRVVNPFEDSVFPYVVGKYVRKNHVQTDEHWTRNVKPNPCFA